MSTRGKGREMHPPGGGGGLLPSSHCSSVHKPRAWRAEARGAFQFDAPVRCLRRCWCARARLAASQHASVFCNPAATAVAAASTRRTADGRCRPGRGEPLSRRDALLGTKQLASLGFGPAGRYRNSRRGKGLTSAIVAGRLPYP